MTNEQHDKCQLIIHSAAVSAGAAGALPIPGSDAIPIAAIQTAMIIGLGSVFDKRITESIAVSMAGRLMAESAGKVVAGGLIKLIPGVGSVVNASVAFTITEAMGWEVAEDFARDAA